MDRADQILTAIFSEGPQRLTFSEPEPGQPAVRAVLRPVSSGGKTFQLEKHLGTQVFHENWTGEEAKANAAALFLTFRRLNATTGRADHSLRKTKKGKLFYQQKAVESAALDASPSHNRQKNYILREGEDIRPLKDLGVFTAEGKVAAPMYDKFRQINRFIELIDDVAAKDGRSRWHVVDFGCGKSYLTFVLYYYLTKILGKEAEIIGFDLKQDVIDRCSRLALEYGYTGLSFRCGDVADYKPETKPDLVISLHACDIATDFALFHGVSVGADYIFSVPCCQHELNAVFAPTGLSLLADYGILKERFSALATDALRAGMLEYAGYKTQVLEFIDLAHSPKNLLLRASRRTVPLPAAQKKQLAKKIRLMLAETGAAPSIVRLLRFDTEGI